MSRRTTTRPEVRITANGAAFWLSTIVPVAWGDLKHSTRTNGSWQASWTIPIVPNWRHPALVYGAAVDVFLGPVCVWAGSLEEPNWDAGEFVALGACRDAETNPGLTSVGDASTVPNVVVDAAISDGGLPGWTRVGDLGATAVGQSDGTGGLVSIASILDAAAQEASAGTRWVVNEQRQVFMASVDETKPTWHVIPGSGVLGSAAEERVDRIYVRYIDATTGRRATVSYPATGPARIKKPADITDRGPKTVAQATAIAQDEWNKLQGRSGWTNGLTLTTGQVTTPGGAIADLALVKAGDTIRLLGVPDARGLAQNTDVVLAETDYDWAEDQLQANPVGRAARDEESVLEQIGNLAVDASTRAGSGGGMAPFAIATGVVNVALSAVNSAFTNITFPAGRFTVAPIVLATLQSAPSGSQKFVPRVLNATTSGASVYVYTGDTTAQTATVNVAWEAIQMTPTSAVG